MNDVYSGGILQVVHTGDCPVTWGASFYSIGSGSHVYGTFLEEFQASHVDIIHDEHCFSSPNRRLIRDDHPDFRGHATGMRP